MLETEKTVWTLEKRWTKLTETLLEKVEDIICGRRTYKKQFKRTQWWNSEIKQLVKQKKTAWKTYIQTMAQRDR